MGVGLLPFPGVQAVRARGDSALSLGRRGSSLLGFDVTCTSCARSRVYKNAGLPQVDTGVKMLGRRISCIFGFLDSAKFSRFSSEVGIAVHTPRSSSHASTALWFECAFPCGLREREGTGVCCPRSWAGIRPGQPGVRLELPFC